MEIGRYEVVRELGAGAQGRVLEAIQHGPDGPGRRVALKLGTGAGDPRREARLGGLLRHVNLVDVYEEGTHGGTPFVALELCRDGSLAGRGALPPRAVVEVGLQVARALQHAHDTLGLVHLDLKPANLLLDGPTVKVADLGVAVAAGFEGGSVRGTPAYMAPEQRAGGEVDARTDVWALGVVLAELASGLPPHAAATFEEGASVVRDVPEWLRPVHDRCTADDPSDRFPSARALEAALAALDADGPGLAEALGLQARPPQPADLAPTPFVGRGAERAAVHAALASAGVVVLKGPPGIGKSRLAAEVAAARAVALTVDLGSAERVDVAVAGALGLGPEATAATVGDALAARGDLLVVLDDGDALADRLEDVSAWAAAAPRCRFLVTSRVRPGLPGALVLELEPLPPADAVSLLRNAAARRGVVLGLGPACDELVERLDGSPLALELAAGRLGVLRPEDLLARLELGLLRSSGTGRRASLDAALSVSVELLDGPLRSALRDLAVFHGGFSAEDAEAVVVPVSGRPVSARIRELADRSLCVLRQGRWTLPRTVRAWPEVTPEAEERHRRWFARLGTPDALEALDGPGGTERRRVLKRELGNLVAAVRSARRTGEGDVAVQLLLAGSAAAEDTPEWPSVVEQVRAVSTLPGLSPRARFTLERIGWELLDLHGHGPQELTAPEPEDRAEWALAVGLGEQRRGHARRALDLLEAAAAAPTLRPSQRLRAAIGAAACHASVSPPEVSRARLAEVEHRARAEGRERWLVLVLANQGVWAFRNGLPHESLRKHEEACALAEAQGAHRYVAMLRGTMANALREVGDRAGARREYRVALALHEAHGNQRSAAVAEHNLGMLERTTTSTAEALPLLARSLARATACGDTAQRLLSACNLGSALAETGRVEEGLALLRDAASGYLALGNRQMAAWAAWRLAERELACGVAGAEERVRGALALGPSPSLRGDGLRVLAQCLLARGAVDEAARAVAEAADCTVPDSFEAVRQRVVEAELARCRGDGALRRERAETARDGLRALGIGAATELGRAVARLSEP